MGKKCVIPHCYMDHGDDDGTGRKVSFHAFPKDPLIRSEWIRRSGRGPDFEPPRTRGICSKHFTADCYRLDRCDKNVSRRRQKAPLRQRMLFDDAIPTLFEAHLHSCVAGECYVSSKKCMHCDDFIAYSEKDLRHHISAFHVGYLPLGCGHCLNKQRASWFATQESLELHTVLDHTGLDVKAVPKREKRKETKVEKMMTECPGSNQSKADRKTPKAKPLLKPRTNTTKKPTEDRNKRPADTPDEPPETSKSSKPSPKKCRTLLSARSKSGRVLFSAKCPKEQGNTDKEPSSTSSPSEGAQSSPVEQTEEQDSQPQSPGRAESQSPQSPKQGGSKRKRTRSGTERETSPPPKVPKVSFAQEYLERISMPDDISAYLEERRQELSIEEFELARELREPKKTKKVEKKLVRRINTSIVDIEANSCPKPKVPARYSLGALLKSKGKPDETAANEGEVSSAKTTGDSEISQDSQVAPEKPKLPVARSCANLTIRQKYEEMRLKQEKIKEEKLEEKKRLRRLRDNKRARDKRGVYKHLQPQGELLFNCGLCQAAVFGTVDHIGNRHLSAPRYSCGHCNYAMGCHRTMRMHSQKQHPNQEKKIETNHDIEAELVQKHVECFGFDYRTAKLECQVCTRTVAFATDKLVNHSRMVHLNRAVKCATCNKVFNDLETYLSHHEQTHPDVIKRYRKPTAIEMQNACFPAGSWPVPPDFVPRFSGLRERCRFGITCLKCNKAVLIHNISQHAREHSPTVEPHTCPCCNFSNLKARVVAAHIRRVHPKMAHLANGISNKKEVKEENKKSMVECFGFNLVECDYCHATVTFWELKPHAKRHVEELENGGQRTTFAQMAQRCYGTVVQVK